MPLLLLGELHDPILFNILYKQPVHVLVRMRRTCSFMNSVVEKRKSLFAQRTGLGVNLRITVMDSQSERYSIAFDGTNRPDTIFRSSENSAEFEKRIPTEIPIGKVIVKSLVFPPNVSQKLSESLRITCNELHFPYEWNVENYLAFAANFNVTAKISFTCRPANPTELLEFLNNHPDRNKFSISFNPSPPALDPAYPLFKAVRGFKSCRLWDHGGRFKPVHLNHTLQEIFDDQEPCSMEFFNITMSIDNDYDFPFVSPGVHVPPFNKIWDCSSLLLQETDMNAIYAMDTKEQFVVMAVKRKEHPGYVPMVKIQFIFVDKNLSVLLRCILDLLEIRYFSYEQRRSFLTSTTHEEKKAILDEALTSNYLWKRLEKFTLEEFAKLTAESA